MKWQDLNLKFTKVKEKKLNLVRRILKKEMMSQTKLRSRYLMHQRNSRRGSQLLMLKEKLSNRSSIKNLHY